MRKEKKVDVTANHPIIIAPILLSLSEDLNWVHSYSCQALVSAEREGTVRKGGRVSYVRRSNVRVLRSVPLHPVWLISHWHIVISLELLELSRQEAWNI
jgi:hypothetical protein